jgi:hypothetical protein
MRGRGKRRGDNVGGAVKYSTAETSRASTLAMGTRHRVRFPRLRSSRGVAPAISRDYVV